MPLSRPQAALQVGKGLLHLELGQNPGPAADFKNGKQNALMFLVGKVMAKTKGKANPQMVIEILKNKLT